MNPDKFDKARKSRPFKKADIILYAVVVAFTVLAVALAYTKPGSAVEITIAGRTYTYPLNEDRVVDVGHLQVVIRDSKVWVTDADCPDKVCEHTGKISYENQTIVCIPNTITVRITGGDGPDVSTGQS